MRVEGVEVEFPADVAGAVGAQDVEGEGAEPGEVARFGANAALVFEEADIADVMASVFDSPVLADCGADGGGGQVDLRCMEGGLLGRLPEAGGGVLVPGEPGDAGGGDDQTVPVGAETPETQTTNVPSFDIRRDRVSEDARSSHLAITLSLEKSGTFTHWSAFINISVKRSRVNSA